MMRKKPEDFPPPPAASDCWPHNEAARVRIFPESELWDLAGDRYPHLVAKARRCVGVANDLLQEQTARGQLGRDVSPGMVIASAAYTLAGAVFELAAAVEKSGAIAKRPVSGI